MRDSGARRRACGGPGRRVVGARARDCAPALECLPALDVQSIVIEGGAALHAAAWDEGVVDAVQLYVAPVWLGAEGVPLFGGRGPGLTMLDRAPGGDLLGPDVLIEGDVHRPH